MTKTKMTKRREQPKQSSALLCLLLILKINSNRQRVCIINKIISLKFFMS